MDLNALKQYMDFYKSIMPQTPSYGPSSFGGGESAMNQANDQGRALDFAMRAAGQNGGAAGQMPGMQQAPNFFANFSQSPPQGVQIGDNPYSAHAQALQSQPFAQQPERGSVMNYLSRLMK